MECSGPRRSSIWISGSAIGVAWGGSAATRAAGLGGARISIATNSGLAPSSEVGAGLGASGATTTPASLTPRPERHLRTRLAFRPCARAIPEIDAPGSSHADKTFVLSSALWRRRGADLECIGVHQRIGGHHPHAPITGKQGGTARRSRMMSRAAVVDSLTGDHSQNSVGSVSTYAPHRSDVTYCRPSFE